MNILSLPYVQWHLIFVFLPSAILWALNWKYFLRYKKTFLFVTLCSFVWGLPLDILAKNIYSVWHFEGGNNLGIYLWGIPFEEYLFLLLIPQMATGIFLLLRRKYY